MKISAFTCSLLAVAAFACVPVSQAATGGSDNAANYTSWTNGTNGGTGFTAWDLTGNNSNGTSTFAGYFLGSSTDGSGNINSGAQSFGVYANPANGAYANASRSFAGGALNAGQTFRLQLAVNFRNGNKGLNLYNAGGQVLNFNVGSVNGNDGYYYTAGGNAVDTGFAYYADSVFTLAYTQQSATAGLFTISRTSASGGTAASNSLNVALTTNGVNSFTLYNSSTNTGDAQNNLYFNNLSVAVPEPTTCVFMALGATALTVLRRRNK